MDEKDKNSITMVAYIVYLILLWWGGVFIFKKVENMLVLASIIVAIEYFVLIPQLIKRYLSLYNIEPSIQCYIPFYNETMIMKPAIGIAYLVGIVAFIATLIAFLMISPGNSYKSILNFKEICIYLMLFELIVTVIIRGAGYVMLALDINQIEGESIKEEIRIFTLDYFMAYFTSFIPLVRTIGICYLLNIVLKLDKIQGYKVGKNKKKGINYNKVY